MHPLAEPITRHTVPWNRGRLVGQKPPLKLKDIWAIRITLKVAQRRATWPCSTWRSTASSEAVISYKCGSMTW
jgi:hypothetical protein